MHSTELTSDLKLSLSLSAQKTYQHLWAENLAVVALRHFRRHQIGSDRTLRNTLLGLVLRGSKNHWAFLSEFGNQLRRSWPASLSEVLNQF